METLEGAKLSAELEGERTIDVKEVRKKFGMTA